jgi:hypothetical protein
MGRLVNIISPGNLALIAENKLKATKHVLRSKRRKSWQS